MIFNTHSNLRGAHAYLSASKGHWIRYDEDKLARMFLAAKAAERGSRLHDLAKNMILLGIKPERNGTTFSEYVNDCIGFKMVPEQVLYYSPYCYGTADATSFREKLRKLRIFDLKTGFNDTTMDQLLIYAALFCLEYKYPPFDIEIELRIYQNDDVKLLEPDPVDISVIMEKIKHFSKLCESMDAEMEGLA